jgi:hypothetical protein
MRPRICCIVSAQNNSTRSQLSEEQFQQHKRRAEFERSYNKRSAVMTGIKNTIEPIVERNLNKFALGLERAINEFKSKRK